MYAYQDIIEIKNLTRFDGSLMVGGFQNSLTGFARRCWTFSSIIWLLVKNIRLTTSSKVVNILTIMVMRLNNSDSCFVQVLILIIHCGGTMIAVLMIG